MRLSRTSALTAVGVAALAAAWFWPGTYLTLESIDQGQIVYGAWRFARGDLPYRDFDHVYGPSVFLLNGTLLLWSGEDLQGVRLGLLATKALLAALLFVVARTVARPAIALVVTAWFVSVWGAPLWLYATPYAGHYALACGLFGLAILVTREPGSWRPAFLAGLCNGVGATFKQTTGIFGAVSMLVVIASGPVAGGARDDAARAARWPRLVVVVAAGLMAAGYLSRALRSGSGWVLLVPVLGGLLGECWRDRGDEARPVAGRPRLADTLAFGVGFAVPLLAWLAAYAARGAAGDLIHDTLSGLPQLVDWAVPLGTPDVWAAVLGGALVAVGFASRARRAGLVVGGCLAVGSVVLRAALVRGGGASVQHALCLFPVVVTCAAAPIALARPDAVAQRLVWWFSAFACLTLHPAADLPHALMVLPAVLPALAILLDGAWTGTRGHPLERAVAAGCVVGVLAAHGVQAATMLRRAVAERPRDAPGFDRADGVWDARPEFRDMLGLVALLDRLQPRGTPLLVLPSAQMLYVLADRPSALQPAEMVFYLLSIDAIRPAAARTLLDDSELVAALDARHPLIVQVQGDGWQRVAAAFPELARRIDERYIETARVGSMRLLAPRGR